MQHCCNSVMARRKTPSKSAILGILKEAGSPLSHDMLQDRLEKEMDRTTIYRILNRFHEDGVIHKVVCDDGKQYFSYCWRNDQNHNHFHFRCQKCGRVECLNKKIRIDLPKGYEAKTFNGVISGYCSNCKDKKIGSC